MRSDGAVLVTGAAGVIGDALVAARTAPVVALVHRSRPAPELECVQGDISRERFGLAPGEFAELARRTTAIVHAAGVTDYGAPLDQMRSVNVDGTRRVLELAELAECPVYYTSTVGLMFDDGLAGTASEGTPDAFSPRNYMSTKAEAERMLGESQVPTSVLRITWVGGDSRSGRIKRFQGLYLLAQTLLLDSIPLIPARPSDRVDFLPQDLIVRAIWFLVERGETPPLVWLTAGPAAPTIESVLEVFLDYAESLGIEVDMPRFADPDIVDRLIRPVFLDAFSDTQRARFEQLIGLMGALSEPFPSSLGELAAAGLDVDFDPRAALTTALEYWGGKKRIQDRHRARQQVHA